MKRPTVMRPALFLGVVLAAILACNYQQATPLPPTGSRQPTVTI